MIDDSEDFRATVSARLKAEGFELTTVGSGREGLDATAKQTFDLILLDMLMPEKDGMATYQELRASPKTREVPIILLTVAAVEGHWEPMQYQEEHCAFVMGKPYDHTILLSRIHQLLTQTSGG